MDSIAQEINEALHKHRADIHNGVDEVIDNFITRYYSFNEKADKDKKISISLMTATDSLEYLLNYPDEALTIVMTILAGMIVKRNRDKEMGVS